MKRRIISLFLMMCLTCLLSVAKNVTAGKACNIKCSTINNVIKIDNTTSGGTESEEGVLMSSVHAVVLGI